LLAALETVLEMLGDEVVVGAAGVFVPGSGPVDTGVGAVFCRIPMSCSNWL
jgi:hypothetical protein